MRNMRVIATRYGGPEVLRVAEEECPEPKAGEVRVRVLAAGVALPDIMAREGVHPETPPAPFTPGWDLVGVVDRVGAGVSGIEPGQTVAAMPISGAYAEFVCLPPAEHGRAGGQGQEEKSQRSTDGTSWTLRTGFEVGSPSPLFDAVWGSGRWGAVGQARWVSPDGATWSRAAVDYSARASFAVGWNGERFVSVGFVDVGLSADGLTWVLATGAPYDFPIWGLAWSGYHWLALSLDAASTSPDGITWTDIWLSPYIPGPFLGTPPTVIWDGDWYPARYLAAGGGIWTSP